MSRTYRKPKYGDPNWTTEYLEIDRFETELVYVSRITGKTIRRPYVFRNTVKHVRRATKEEYSDSVRDGKWKDRNHRQYFNIAHRKFRANDRNQFSKIDLDNLEDFNYDDSNPRRWLKSIWWEIY